jgi:serine/threonine-protein kinase
MAARSAQPKLAVVQGGAGAGAAAGDPAADPPYRAGDLIADKYKLISVIGEGGMGSVWRAKNRILHIDVAIKLINRQLASVEAAQRLLIEARSAAQLGHPSIVRVHDFGVTDRGDAFIVMELLTGESLATLLDKKGPLEPVAAVRLLLPILGALGAAHGKGIVHRDLKPDNIILVKGESDYATPKLVDFGIAKVEQQPIPDLPDDGTNLDEEQLASRLARRLTLSGKLLGSPEYMSPEQARGDEVDGRTDLWAMAVVLYEAVTGTMPFTGVRVDKLLVDILTRQPSPTTDFEVGDESFWSILARGLKKKKHARWDSARELGEALASWLLTQGIDTDICGASVRQHWLGMRIPGPLSDPLSVDEAADINDPQGVKATPLATPQLDLPEPRDDDADTASLVAAGDEIPTDPPPRPDDQRRVTMAVLIGAIVLLPTLGVVAAVVLLRDEAGAGSNSGPAAATAPMLAPDHPPLLPSRVSAPGDSAAPDASADAGTDVQTPPKYPRRPAYRPQTRPSNPKPTSAKGSMPLPAVPNF